MNGPPDILTDHRADVVVLGWRDTPPHRRLATALDRADLRAVADVEGCPADPERLARICLQSSAVVALDDADRAELAAARRAGPVTVVDASRAADVVSVLTLRRPAEPAYALFIGRMERDFDQARQAIRVAVEAEAGIPCVWVDDGRHRTGIDSVRLQTEVLLRHASLVVADLTLGVENRWHTNPSRAHELGMAVAYGRKILLYSQEPRRVPYYAISDLQMRFWGDEAELEEMVRAQVRADRAALGRTVLNPLATSDGHRPRIRPPVFRFDPSRRYVGPGRPEE